MSGFQNRCGKKPSSKSDFKFQLTLPTAFDEAGLKMLDSIREIFDILGIDFESVRFNWIKYYNEKDLINAINNGKCPVADVLKSYYSTDTDRIVPGSHAMVATGIQEENGAKKIQLKNSFADDPNEQGKVRFLFIDLECNRLIILNFFEI